MPKAQQAKEGTKPDVHLLEKTNDPVRMYLREMGTVPLLTKAGEVSIARRIERGERMVLNGLAESTWILGEIRTMGERITKGEISPNTFVTTEEDVDEDPRRKLQRARQTITRMNRAQGQIEAARKRLRRMKEGTKNWRTTTGKIAHLDTYGAGPEPP